MRSGRRRPITITAANTASTQWPVTLGNAVNAMNGNVRIGVLNTQQQHDHAGRQCHQQPRVLA